MKIRKKNQLSRFLSLATPLVLLTQPLYAEDLTISDIIKRLNEPRIIDFSYPADPNATSTICLEGKNVVWAIGVYSYKGIKPPLIYKTYNAEDSNVYYSLNDKYYVDENPMSRKSVFVNPWFLYSPSMLSNAKVTHINKTAKGKIYKLSGTCEKEGFKKWLSGLFGQDLCESLYIKHAMDRGFLRKHLKEDEDIGLITLLERTKAFPMTINMAYDEKNNGITSYSAIAFNGDFISGHTINGSFSTDLTVKPEIPKGAIKTTWEEFRKIKKSLTDKKLKQTKK